MLVYPALLQNSEDVRHFLDKGERIRMLRYKRERVFLFYLKRCIIHITSLNNVGWQPLPSTRE